MDTSDSAAVARRAAELFNEQSTDIAVRTDRMFAGLMAAQWLFGIAVALWVSPRTWAGTASFVHLHVYAAILLGGTISSLPIVMGILRPGEAATRHVIAVGQMLTSALLIHLTGGRIETHFHVFGSLAFLAFYRDWRVLLTASAVVALDHGLRGIYWPQSVYGVTVIQPWRFLEHTAWVAFEDAFLCFSILKGIEEMWGIAIRQARLEATNRTIESEVIKRTNELARSNADLEQFAYVASHDLKEPLRKVGSFTQLLAQRYDGRLDPEADTLIARVVDGVARMMMLIDSLLQYSRVGEEAVPLERTDVSGLLKRIVDDLDLSGIPGGATITSEPLPTVLANGPQLRQVFQNLLVNALKFRRRVPPRIHVSAERMNGDWVFRVQDNGIGIDPRYASQLFVMFKRLHSRAEYPGTGIGLAICKKIVERHGGRIWIESKQGKGAEVCFTLPAKEEDHEESVVQHSVGRR